jgi:chromosome partitioning protein
MVDGTDVKNIILTTSIEHLDLVPSHIDLVGAEVEMINMDNREEKMKEVIAPLTNLYDFIIIDCSPSLGLITINALTAANSVLIPVQCEYFALEGLGKLLNTIKIIQTRLNPELEIEGILLTMYDVRLRLSNQVVEEVRLHFKNMVFNTIIPRNVRLSESPSFGLPVIAFDAEGKGSIAYLNLAGEIAQKNGLQKVTN